MANRDTCPRPTTGTLSSLNLEANGVGAEAAAAIARGLARIALDVKVIQTPLSIFH
jgi:hypothetical protein